MDLSPREHLDSFEIVSLLGKGGVGALHVAWDLELGRDVEIKVFRSDLFSDPPGLERFESELVKAMHEH
jgi:serine/threonine protein kinase